MTKKSNILIQKKVVDDFIQISTNSNVRPNKKVKKQIFMFR